MGPLGIIAAAWLAEAWSVALWAAIAGRSPRAPLASPSSGGRRRVVLLRPCAGGEPELRRALLSSREAIAKSVDLSVRFAVAEEGDPAFQVAASATQELRQGGMDARLLLTRAKGPNRKADQLGRALAGVEADVVLVADSDVDLRGFDIDALLYPFSDERVAAVWAPPIEVIPETLGDRASSALLDTSMHAFAVLGALDSWGMVGKLIALRKAHLDAVGGFDSLRTCLGEDMELARRFRANQNRVVRHSTPARSLAQGRTSLDVARRYSRWIAVIRAQRPLLLLSYPCVIAPFLPLAATALVLAIRDPAAGLSVLALAVLYRVFVAGLARARSRSERPFGSMAVDAWLADVLILAAFARAVVSRRLRWRGVPLRIRPDGALLQEDGR